MKKLFVMLLVSVFAVSCGNGHKKDAKTFEAALEASTGQTFTVAKLNTAKGEYVVYRNDATGEYVAYNMAKWDRETMTTLDQFLASAVDGVDIVRNLGAQEEWVESGYWRDIYVTDYDTEWDDFCECYQTVTEQIWVGQEWIDTSHWSTFYYGGGFRFDNTSTQSRDLDTIAALKEEAAEQFIAHRLAGEFSLSNNRATELAKLANRYQKLENARELTAGEKDKFAMDALGVSMTQVERAMRNRAEGNENQYQQMLETAARVNNTTPEQIGRFFTEMVGEEI